MNKKLLAVLIILIIIAGTFGVYYLTKKENVIDNIQFASEYTLVGENNIFKYKSSEEILKILTNGTGIVLLGFPECPWCQQYALYLNEIAKEENVAQIYYYNIKNDREKNTEFYQKVVNLLGDNLLYDDEGNNRIYVPDVTFVKNGKIIAHDNETSVVSEEDGTPEEYWTESQVSAFKSKIKTYITKLNENVCTTCK